MILEPSAARDRLTAGLSHIDDDRGLARLEKAFALVTAADAIDRRMRAARIKDWREAVKRGVITASEGERIRARRGSRCKSRRGGRLCAGATVEDRSEDDLPREELFAREVRGRKLMARPVYIVDGSRTPFLKARSGPGPFTPVDLAVQCGRPLLARQPFAPDAFDQVILGCVNVIADEMNPARVAALRLGMGERMVAFTEQVNCGSGMQSIDTAFRYIREGRCELILAGGTEALEPCAAGLAAAGRALVRRACDGQGRAGQDRRRAEGAAELSEADHRAGARPDRSGGRDEHGPDRRNGRAAVRHHAASSATPMRSKATSASRARSRKVS